MAMNLKDMVGRLQSLSRMVALSASSREDLDVEGKCMEASRLFLEILDGKTPHFPKCILNPNPAGEDVREQKMNNDAWLDMNITLHEDLSGRFTRLVEDEMPAWPVRESGPYSQDEVTAMFLHSMQSAALYWSTVHSSDKVLEKYSERDCCEGTIFAIFNVLDGTNMASPMFDVVPDIDDISSRPEVSDFQGIVLDCYMHDGFYRAEVFNPDPDLRPTP